MVPCHPANQPIGDLRRRHQLSAGHHPVRLPSRSPANMEFLFSRDGCFGEVSADNIGQFCQNHAHPPIGGRIGRVIRRVSRGIASAAKRCLVSDSPALQDAFEQFCRQDQSVLVEANDISFHQTENISALASAVVPPDKSLTNASSIGFILEFLNRRALFLGDSTPEASTAALQYWQRQTGNPLYFDVIKMPHHGSKRNCLELLDYVDSPLYLISSDGTQYNHPSPETIAKIVFRPTRQTRRIVFNYPHSIYARFSNPEWKSQYRYDVLVAEQIDLMEARYEGTI